MHTFSCKGFATWSLCHVMCHVFIIIIQYEFSDHLRNFTIYVAHLGGNLRKKNIIICINMKLEIYCIALLFWW